MGNVNGEIQGNSASWEVDGAEEPVSYDGIEAAEVKQLARQYTRQSSELKGSGLSKSLTSMSGVPGVEAVNHPDERLDPESDRFDSRFWVKNYRKLTDRDPDYYKPSKLGIGYRNLVCSGVAVDADYAPTVLNAPLKFVTDVYNDYFNKSEDRYFSILKSMDGLMLPGEVTVVLGRPGAGCSTLLKTIASQTYGFKVDPGSTISYDGLTPKEIDSHHRGDVIYSAETDVHFPLLTVGQTLEFAAKMRTPQNRGTVDRDTYSRHFASVYMATYGLSHTRHTQVGNDFIRGVSGGERKRVSIAEVSLSGANLQCWDNATRGLDAATALEFIKALKTSATVLEATPLIAIYQCSQDAYDLFDKVVVLYEGYQIFFGRADEAKEYFEEMGYECPARQTTADFLTSITNPAERIIRKGAREVPRTPEQFEAYWKNSSHYKQLLGQIDGYFDSCKTLNTKESFAASHNAKQANHVRRKSPYTVSFPMQIRYLAVRSWHRMKANWLIPIIAILSQVIMGLIVSSVFYNLQPNTDSFTPRGNAITVGLIFSAFASITELFALYEGKRIIEKHKKYALYRPSAEAIASTLTELPVKVLLALGFNIVFYFMTNLRRKAGNFFIFLLFSFMITLVMSTIFRSMGAFYGSLEEAFTYTPLFLIGLVLFTGYMIPVNSMLGWCRWMNYINPLSYGMESLMANEFHDRDFECSQFVPEGPGYEDVALANKICNAVSAKAGQSAINGSKYLDVAFSYRSDHIWRNFGIMVGFTLFFFGAYCLLYERNKGAMQKGEITLFLRGGMKKPDEEAAVASGVPGETGTSAVHNGAARAAVPSSGASVDTGTVPNGASRAATPSSGASGSTTTEGGENEKDGAAEESRATYHWRDLTYQVKVKEGHRVLLDHVDGWVKPGQLTALMGSSGAGKTTLLNCLSERLTVGVITDGLRMVNGHALDSSFQRSIGYAQQQDIHLAATTVREALQFSAYLRQSRKYSKHEKDEYVEYVIDLLEMARYADAVVGVEGEGLNVEQRKRLTIGVELAARPKLLLFLDEPTSGLDSQTAWSVCKLMRKLANHGQAILCTIHQPSAMLLQEFDRLLFLQKGGQTVYFGDLGKNSSTLIDYFERHGADPCPPEANPAEWMLQVVGAAPGSHARQDYFDVWRKSEEFEAVRKELEGLEGTQAPVAKDEDSHRKYAASVGTQLWYTTERVARLYYRNPKYIYSKVFLIVSSGLYIGFVLFRASATFQGLKSQLFGLFQSLVPMYALVQQLYPVFISYREIYEVREAPSRTFSWVCFLLSIIAVEIAVNFVMGTLFYFVWAYPIGFYKNAEETGTVHERGALLWLMLSSAFAYCGTLAQLIMSFNELMENAGNFTAFLITLFVQFNGILFAYDKMPGFWKFLYRADPLTYFVQAVAAAGLSDTKTHCSDYELLRFPAPSGQTCKQYMSKFVKYNGGGFLVDPLSKLCEFCSISNSDQYLHLVNIYYGQRWRNYGIFICYFGINILLTLGMYYLIRVPKGSRQKS